MFANVCTGLHILVHVKNMNFLYSAELSHQKMECMKVKYADIHDKMERSRKLLQNAQERIDRQEQVQKTVRNLRQKADLYQSKLNMQKLLKEGVSDGTGFDFPQPLINYEEEEAKSGKLITLFQNIIFCTNTQNSPVCEFEFRCFKNPKMSIFCEKKV